MQPDNPTNPSVETRELADSLRDAETLRVGAPPGLPNIVVRPKEISVATGSISVQREVVRRRLAWFIVGVFGLTIVLGFSLVAWHQSFGLEAQEAVDLFKYVFATEAALLGPILGFYFASTTGASDG